MNKEQQRIAIAELCGWTIETRPSPQSWLLGGWPPLTPDYQKTSSSLCYRQLPDYLNDLNAMHEAERVLLNAQRREYIRQLVLVHPLKYSPFQPNDDQAMRVYFLVSTSAAQRAEAFLRTLGKWVEGKE